MNTNNREYTISANTPPAMPRLGKGTEAIRLILSQISKDMRQPVTPALIPILSAHICGAEWTCPDNSRLEVCGMMAYAKVKKILSPMGHRRHRRLGRRAVSSRL